MALFKDIEDFATCAPVLKSAAWEMLKPSIDLVERQYLRDHVLGTTLYDQLHSAYQASIAQTPTPLTPDMQNLLDRCRPAVAGLAAHQAIPKLSVMFTTGGPMVSQTETMKPASQWKTNAATKALLQEGLGCLDQLIDFLIANAGTYSWSTSPFAVQVNDCLVRTAKDCLAYHVDIGNSGWLLHRLRPAMRQVQERIKATLCDDAYNDLLAAVQAGTVTGTNAKILDLARPAIIHLALARMATLASVTIDAEGVWTWEASSGGAVSGGPIPAKDQRLDRVVEVYTQQGEACLARMFDLAVQLAKAGQYPLFLNSTCYPVEPPDRNTTPPDSSTFSSL